MEIDDLLAKIRTIQIELAQKAPQEFFRYLFRQINIENRLNIFIGARGSTNDTNDTNDPVSF